MDRSVCWRIPCVTCSISRIHHLGVKRSTPFFCLSSIFFPFLHSHPIHLLCILSLAFEFLPAAVIFYSPLFEHVFEHLCMSLPSAAVHLTLYGILWASPHANEPCREDSLLSTDDQRMNGNTLKTSLVFKKLSEDLVRSHFI